MFLFTGPTGSSLALVLRKGESAWLTGNILTQSQIEIIANSHYSLQTDCRSFIKNDESGLMPQDRSWGFLGGIAFDFGISG